MAKYIYITRSASDTENIALHPKVDIISSLFTNNLLKIDRLELYKTPDYFKKV